MKTSIQCFFFCDSFEFSSLFFYRVDFFVLLSVVEIKVILYLFSQFFVERTRTKLHRVKKKLGKYHQNNNKKNSKGKKYERTRENGNGSFNKS